MYIFRLKINLWHRDRSFEIDYPHILVPCTVCYIKYYKWVNLCDIYMVHQTTF